MRLKTIETDSPLPTGFLPQIRLGGWARLFLVYSVALALICSILFGNDMDSYRHSDARFHEYHRSIILGDPQITSPLILKQSIDAVRNFELAKTERERRSALKFLALWFCGLVLVIFLGFVVRWIANGFKDRSSLIAGEGQAGAPGGSGLVEKL